MTDPNSYIPEDSPNLEFVYNNESTLQPTYWPIFYSELVNKQDARELYNDDSTQYITYSGNDWKSLMVSKQKDGRYRNFTIKSFSGESFDFYLEVGSLYDINQSFYAGPVTTSGSYNTLVYYSGEASAQSNLVTFTAPTDNTSVFVLPEVSTASYIKLHHKAVSSGETYRLYQFLPRTLIQVDDLEADAIDAVTIRVSDSIVVTADDLAPGSITGEKILAGTISGVLITPGTITANEINVAQLDALASNMGTLTVNSGITLGSEGFLWTGYSNSGEYTLTKKGVKVVNSFTVGTVVYAPGGGESVVLGNLDDAARTVSYTPTYYTTPSGSFQSPQYTLTAYSGDLRYFEITANQFGQLGESQQEYNGYNGEIRLGFAPSVGDDFNSNYSSLRIGSVASGYSLLRMYSYGGYAGTTPEASVLDLEKGKTLLTTTNRIQLNSPVIRCVSSLKVSKDVSQPAPYFEEYSDILSVSDSGFVYNKPSDSYFPPNSVELLRVTPSGNMSLTGDLTVSGGFSGVGAYFAGSVGVGTSSPSYKLQVVGDTFSTNLYASTGDTAASPSHSWASDPDTGIYHAALDIIGFSTNGAEAARINSNNVLSVNTTNQNGQITVEVPDGTARYTLTLRQLNDSSPFINFAGGSSAGTTTPVNTAAVGTYRGKVRVGINGVVRWIPFYD